MPTFAEVLSQFLETRKAKGREPATLRSYRFMIDSFLAPELGDRDVAALTFRDLESLYAVMSFANYVPSTIRKCHTTANGALKFAVREGWILSNPASIVELPAMSKPEREIPTPEAVKAYIAFASVHDPLISDYARVLSATGMRPGEACALMLADLDMSGTLTIQRALDVSEGSARLKSTKTGRIRRIAIDEETHAVIAARPGPFVFGEESPKRTDLMSKRFRRVGLKGGVCFKPRLLRHFHATQLIAAGMDLKAVSVRLGHSSPVITGEVYIGAVPANDGQAAELISRVLDVSHIVGKLVESEEPKEGA